ncbi:unnamed protein product [Leuciscus chuanchicus]
MTSPLQLLDFLSQQHRVFPSAGSLCPIRMARTPRCTAEGVKTSELIHEGAQDMLFSSAHITKWPPTDAHLP